MTHAIGHRITAAEAIAARKNGAILIVVRSSVGLARKGGIAEAVVAPKTLVVDLLGRQLQHGRGPFVLFCGSVARTTSPVEAHVLEGLSQVYEGNGGFAALAEVGTLHVSERLLTRCDASVRLC
jgi:rhodanese-related sulfurtransferase